jgi:hypothetical protein
VTSINNREEQSVKGIYDLTEHELTVEGRKLVKALYDEMGSSLRLEAFTDEGKLVIKVPRAQLAAVTFQKNELIGSEEFTLNPSDVTMGILRD